MIEERQSRNTFTHYNKGEIFLNTTKGCLVNLLKFIIETENVIERERERERGARFAAPLCRFIYKLYT